MRHGVLSLWQGYSKCLKARPLVTGMVTSGGIMCGGDIMAQRLKDGSVDKFDWRRNAIVTSWNAFVFSPVFFYWFRALDRRYPGKMIIPVLKKVTLNQTIAAVPVNLAFLAYTTALTNLFDPALNHSDTFSEVKEQVFLKLQHDLKEIFCSSSLVWYPTNLLNFLLVPQEYRILPTILMSLMWSTYLSTVANRELSRDE
mmetsp:Transcript_11137/g.23923  ORF Transcript_11137/g.23923 Transcript_11137/m.23923 type:complete len:199 (-) Transcript_11137:179-775(-)